MNSISAVLSADEDHGRTSEEEEEGAGGPSCDRQVRSGTIAAFFFLVDKYTLKIITTET